MATIIRPHSSSRNLWSFPTWIVGAIGLLLVAAVMLWANPNKNSSPLDSTSGGEIKEMQQQASKDFILGDINGISYYHCGGASTDEGNAIDLILLHGAAFTKENWKESGILKNFCSFTRLNVVALDLPNGSTHDDLKQAMDVMRREKILSSASDPVALITPSMSGFTVVDWILSGDTKELLQYVSHWIPVASGSVSKLSESQLRSVKDKLSILALYGSRDSGGKVTSQSLETYANAKMIEIEGGHPCYLDSPDDFIRHCLTFLKVQ